MTYTTMITCEHNSLIIKDCTQILAKYRYYVNHAQVARPHKKQYLSLDKNHSTTELHRYTYVYTCTTVSPNKSGIHVVWKHMAKLGR